MTNKTIFTDRDKKNIENNSKEIKKLKEEMRIYGKSLGENNKRVEKLEEGRIRAEIIKLLKDTSKTGRCNYSVKEIIQIIKKEYDVSMNEYDIKKIQKDEGMIRKNGRVDYK